MREFKFRAWDTKLNIMIFEDSDFEAIEQKYNDSCYWAGERYPCICPEAMFGFKMDRFIKMQYTGLKDKNGVEIYEGDIIGLGKIDGKFFAGIVVFNEDIFGGPCFCIQENEDTFHTFFDKDDDERFWFEAVGNIYENPELYKNKEFLGS